MVMNCIETVEDDRLTHEENQEILNNTYFNNPGIQFFNQIDRNKSPLITK